MIKVRLLASSILMFTLVIATGCSDDSGAHFETLGAHVDRNEDGQVVAVRSDGSSKITDADLTALADLTSLKELHLTGAGIQGDGLANLQGLEQLETLDLAETRVTDRALAHLRHVPNLRELRLQSCGRLTDEGLQHLDELENLRVLSLSLNPQITDLQHLGSLPKLEKLILNGCAVTDNGLRSLSSLTSLRALNLRNTYVTDDGLAHLKDLPALEELYLMPGVFLTDDGRFNVFAAGETAPSGIRRLITDAGLIHLQDCKQLATLEIGGIHSVTEDGVMSLKQALPDCAVSVSGHK